MNFIVSKGVNSKKIVIDPGIGFGKTVENNFEIINNLNHFTNLIVNLLDNAVKYSKGSPQINISSFNEAKKIFLKISDEGIGMDINTQKQIFEKFFRKQSGNIHNVKGHGLGLSYVKKIVELHDGDIKLTSKIGEGTTFIISVPLL